MVVSSAAPEVSEIAAAEETQAYASCVAGGPWVGTPPSALNTVEVQDTAGEADAGACSFFGGESATLGLGLCGRESSRTGERSVKRLGGSAYGRA